MVTTKRIIALALGTWTCLSGRLAPARDVEAYPKLTVSIPRICAPRIDGDLTDIGWTHASLKGGVAIIDLVHSWQHAPMHRTDSPRIVYLGYDEEALYICMVTHVKDAAEWIDAPDNGWYGDALEFNIWPDPKKGFVNLVINAAALYGQNCFDGTERHDKIKVASKATDIRWNLEVAIPFKWLRMPTPSPGDRVPLTLAVREPKKKSNHNKGQGLLWKALRGKVKIKDAGTGVFTR